MRLRVSLTAGGILILFLILNVFDYYFTAVARIGRYPKPVTLEFYSSNNRLWHRYYSVKKFSLPVDAEKLSTDQTRIVKNFFIGKSSRGEKINFTQADTWGNRLTLSFYLAPLLFGKSRVSLYIIQRLREYRNMALLSLFCSEKKLLCGLLNWKRSIHNAYGGGILSRAVYGKDFTRLTPEETLSILTFLYGTEKGGESPSEKKKFMKKTADYLEEKNRNLPACGGSFRDYVLSLLKKQGILEEDENLKVYTTMEEEIQERLEQYAVDYLEGMKGQDDLRRRLISRLPPVEGAAVVVKTGTGAISGLMGTIRYSEVNSFNRAVNSRRQISSTIKPFLYALAIEMKGYTGDSKFTDKPVEMKNRDGTSWKPGNYYPYYLGEVTFREGLVVSINTIAVQLIKILGVSKFAERAREVFRMNENSIGTRIKKEPSLSLGSIDLSPLELAKGYLVISSRGREIIPFPLKHVLGEEGRIIKDYRGRFKNSLGRRLYPEKAMEEVRDIMKEVITRGTARRFIDDPFPFDIAGKSGSSPSDSWFAGFNSSYLLVTWAGYERPSLSEKGKLPEFVVIPYWYNLMRKLVPAKKSFER